MDQREGEHSVKRGEFEGKEPRKSKELPGETPADRGACTKESSVEGSE